MIHLAFKSIFRNLSARKVGDKKPFTTPIKNVPQYFSIMIVLRKQPAGGNMIAPVNFSVKRWI